MSTKPLELYGIEIITRKEPGYKGVLLPVGFNPDRLKAELNPKSRKRWKSKLQYPDTMQSHQLTEEERRQIQSPREEDYHDVESDIAVYGHYNSKNNKSSVIVHTWDGPSSVDDSNSTKYVYPATVIFYRGTKEARKVVRAIIENPSIHKKLYSHLKGIGMKPKAGIADLIDFIDRDGSSSPT